MFWAAGLQWFGVRSFRTFGFWGVCGGFRGFRSSRLGFMVQLRVSCEDLIFVLNPEILTRG